MCGIVGIAGARDVAPQIVEALRRLEYRGYDSAGIATLVEGAIERRRSPGKLAQLDAVLAHAPAGRAAPASATRAGPPMARRPNPMPIPMPRPRVALVHNGIIENFRELRAELIAKGHKFESETDTEVAVHLVTDLLDQGLEPAQAAMEAARRLTGAYALAMIFAGEESLVIGARKGSPLAVGYGDAEAYLGSDAFALAPFTNRVCLSRRWRCRGAARRPMSMIYDAEGRPANREIKITSASAGLVDKGGYRHFMAKEIHEQPEVIGHTLAHYLDPANLTGQSAASPAAVDGAAARPRG